MSDPYIDNVKSDVDQWVIRCNDYKVASQYASEMGLKGREWAWMPAYSVSDSIQMFRRVYISNV